MVPEVFSVTTSQPFVRWRAATSQSGEAATQRPAFVGGEENLLAGYSFERLLESAGTQGSQLVVYQGPTGVGKSLLVEALQAAWRSRRSNAMVVTLTGADFARRYSATQTPAEIRRLTKELRTCSLFVLENLQELAGRGRAETELRLSIDVLLENNATIVLTCDRPPTEMQNLDAGLASRLCGGLVVPVQLPGKVARTEILRILSHRHGLDLADSALAKLAGATSGNALKLNAVLAELHQFAQAEAISAPLEDDTVDAFLDRRRDARSIELQTITKLVAKSFGLTTTELRSGSRKRPVVRARGVAMLFARQYSNRSLQQIGKHFGGRDHTTVIHACRKAEAELTTDPMLAQAVADLAAQLAIAPTRTPAKN